MSFLENSSSTNKISFLILSASIIFAFWPIRSVSTGERGVITIGGSIKEIKQEGFVFLLPWEKLNSFNIRAEQADVEKSNGSTSDQQPVNTNLTVRYNIDPSRVSEVFEKYSKNGDLSSYVQTATREAYKAVVAKYTAPELISKRAEVSNGVIETLKLKLNVFGANVISIDMRDFDFDPRYVEAIQNKVNQEQLKLAAENKVLTVQAEQREKVVTAEAEAQALKLKADGEAYQTLKQAGANAEALRIQNEALSKNKDVLELKRIEVELAKAEKWDGQLPESIYAGAPIPFMTVK
jgi:prohibitin 2